MAKHIPKEQIERIERETDIVGLISPYVHLSSAGSNLRGLCPFHKEKTPSFTVFPQKNRFHCYGCGRNGGPASFLMEKENYSFPESIENLAGRLNISIEGRKETKSTEKDRDEFQECLLAAAEIFRNNLANSPQSLEYVRERGFSKEIIDRFDLGFAKDEWSSLFDILTKAGITEELMIGTGLVKKRDNSPGCYDFLRNRIVFPIRNEFGRYLGFSGRLLSGKGAKYINPPETENYKKSSVFYGIFEARESIRKKKRVILVEGYFDVLRLHACGFSEALACCGTSVTSEHLKKIGRMPQKELVFLFDGDDAGKKAAEKSAELALTEGIDGKVCLLPQSMDPDDFLRKEPPEALNELLANSPNFSRFLVNIAKTKFRSMDLNEQSKLVQSMLDVRDRIPGNIAKQLWENLIAEEFKISIQDWSNPAPESPSPPPPSENFSDLSFENLKFEDRSFPLNFQILRYLIWKPELIPFAKEHLQPGFFESFPSRRLTERLFGLEKEECSALSSEQLAEVFPEHQNLVYYLIDTLSTHRMKHYDLRDFRQLLYSFLRRYYLNERKKHLSLQGDEITKEMILHWKNKIQELEVLNCPES